MKNLNLHNFFNIKWFAILSILVYLEINIQIQAQYISNNGAYITISDDTAVTINILENDTDATLLNKGTLNVSVLQNNGNTVGNGIYNITGDFTSTGTFFSASGNVYMNGTSAQKMDLGTATFYNLIINNTASVTLNSTQTMVTNMLTINATKKFKIEAAKSLTVTGTISNLGGTNGLILISNSSGMASLIHNTQNVPATVQRYISGAPEAYQFLSAPVSNQNISGSWNPIGTYGNGTGYDLYIYNEPTPCWTYQLNLTAMPTWAAIHPTLSFVKGKGYLYATQAPNPTKEFIGLLNNGNISYPITNESPDLTVKGFNFIGNPYAATIDWSAPTGWTRSDLLLATGGYNMWIWNPTANNYGVYNSNGGTGTNGVNQYIAPTQGFFIRAQNNGSIAMSNAIKVQTMGNTWLKEKNNSTKSSKTSHLKIKISSNEGYGSDEVLLQFGFPQNEAGALKLSSPNTDAPSVYFNYIDQDLSVRYLTDILENSRIPLQFKPGIVGKNREYSLQIDHAHAQDHLLLLEDKKMKIITDLKIRPTYEFKASEGDSEDRFVLHFQEITDSSLDVPVRVFYDGTKINIDLSFFDGPADIQVFDLLGRLLTSRKNAIATLHRLSVQQKQTVYIVAVSQNGKTHRKKVLVH
ncbi:hypothetical protein PI23P_08445 [Polaribacter irgensii 23-P]|uniref:Secretion system C-terminal sorting domain-containing protein n=1 Tax=Polaribacter irgensii 23-P TaxID=313594 RepID=A4BZP8_9FLAO|nr:T9SS sorting signal type C domain-containing protein [Polaribacter irgensii]EAR12641.1 hypothetical protein PI23P_08445 [Polaribacter irgensii 23-P]